MPLILVTGASGFVGTFLLEEMRRRELPFLGVSRRPKKDLIQILTYSKEMNWAPLLVGVDTIVHLAARVHVRNDPASKRLSEFRKANVDATLHLARCAAKAGVRRFVFVSTIKVNGETTEPGKPFRAEDAPNPQGPYAISKAEAEAGLLDIAYNTGLEITIIRPPMVYGPNAKGNVETLARWAKFRLPSPFGTLKNNRSLVHVLNLSSVIIAACYHPKAANEVFLVADGTSISTHKLLLDLGWTKAPRSLDLLFAWTILIALKLRRSTREKLLGNLEVDVEKTRSLLGWKPSSFFSQSSVFRAES